MGFERYTPAERRFLREKLLLDTLLKIEEGDFGAPSLIAKGALERYEEYVRADPEVAEYLDVAELEIEAASTHDGADK